MQLDYMLDFPKEPVYRECCMKIPKVIEVHCDIEWLLKAKNNIYGRHQAGRVWNKFLLGELTRSAVGFRQSNVDECVFYQGLKHVYTVQ